MHLDLPIDKNNFFQWTLINQKMIQNIFDIIKACALLSSFTFYIWKLWET